MKKVFSPKIFLTDWKKNKRALKFAPSPQKKKHLAYMEIVVASAKMERLSIFSKYQSIKII